MKPKQVTEVVEAMMAVAAQQLYRVGSFKMAGALNMTFKKTPAATTRKG